MRVCYNSIAYGGVAIIRPKTLLVDLHVYWIAVAQQGFYYISGVREVALSSASEGSLYDFKRRHCVTEMSVVQCVSAQ